MNLDEMMAQAQIVTALEARIKTLETALAASYLGIDLPSDERVRFVGVYTLRWGKAEEPTIGFVEWTEEEIAAIVADDEGEDSDD